MQKRIDNLRAKLSSMNIDGIYVTNLTNVRYLTGFTGSAGSVLILPDSQHFFTDGRYIEQSKSQISNHWNTPHIPKHQYVGSLIDRQL